MEILVISILFAATAFIFVFLFLLEKSGRLDILQRSIYLANEQTKFISDLKNVNNKSLNPPFDKIEIRELVTAIDQASREGGTSLDKELKKECQISEL